MKHKNSETKTSGLQKVIRTLWIILLVIAVCVGILLYLRNKAGERAQNAAQMLLDAVGISQTKEEKPAGEVPEPTEIPAEEDNLDPEEINNAFRTADDDGELLRGDSYIEPGISDKELQKLIEDVKKKSNEVEVIGVIRIPKTDTELPIIGQWSSKLLKISVCRYQGGKPNEPGHLVIVGHNYKNGAHFGGLKKLEVGDEVYLSGMDGVEKKYVVYKLDVAEPDDFEALTEYRGTCGLSLMTCYKDGTNRLFVRCEMAGGN